MVAPNNLPNKSSGDRQHLKFNRDVLPDFKRRQDSWDDTAEVSGADRMSEQETDSILKWVGLIIMVLVVAGIVGVTLQRQGAKKDAEATALPTTVEIIEKERELVESAVTDYLGTVDLESRMKFVRRPDMVRPLMDTYYADNEIFPLKVWNFERVDARTIDGRQFWSVVANTPEGREILLVESVSGEFKIDWETHVGHNPMNPETYLSERPTERKEFRVYVSPVEYYNGQFSDPEKVLSAKLEFANSQVALYGYIDRNSPEFRRFLELVNSGFSIPLILALEWPESTRTDKKLLPQVKISALVAERWLVTE